MSFFGDIFSWIGVRLSALWKAAAPELVSDFKLFVSTFEEAAISAVEDEALKTIDGSEKFANAKTKVTAIVIAAGWKASETALTALVQDAYLSFKASKNEPLATPPASLKP